MLRILVTILLTIHGLIHLLGFVKEFKLATVEQLRGKTIFPLTGGSDKVMGALWLLTSILILVTAILVFLKKEWWWMLGAFTFVLSQCLIVLYWEDAKFGTIANLILLIAIIFSFASWSFHRTSEKEISAFVSRSSEDKKVITQEMIEDLPSVVQRWLLRSGIIGKGMIHAVYLKQKGEMRTTPDGNWMVVKAEQHFNVIDPGFIWIADVAANPYFHLSGRDKYQEGRGHMLIKALSLITVADSKGKEIDQGTMLRFLGESVWFPSFALSEYLNWEEIDSASAKVTMSYGGISASGIFRFNSDGDLVSFLAKRYYDRKEGLTLEDWLVETDPNGYREFEGIRVPAKLSVTWKLKGRDFTWYKLEIEDIDYNNLIHSRKL